MGLFQDIFGGFLSGYSQMGSSVTSSITGMAPTTSTGQPYVSAGYQMSQPAATTPYGAHIAMERMGYAQPSQSASQAMEAELQARYGTRYSGLSQLVTRTPTGFDLRKADMAIARELDRAYALMAPERTAANLANIQRQQAVANVAAEIRNIGYSTDAARQAYLNAAAAENRAMDIFAAARPTGGFQGLPKDYPTAWLRGEGPSPLGPALAAQTSSVQPAIYGPSARAISIPNLGDIWGGVTGTLGRLMPVQPAAAAPMGGAPAGAITPPGVGPTAAGPPIYPTYYPATPPKTPGVFDFSSIPILGAIPVLKEISIGPTQPQKFEAAVGQVDYWKNILPQQQASYEANLAAFKTTWAPYQTTGIPLSMQETYNKQYQALVQQGAQLEANVGVANDAVAKANAAAGEIKGQKGFGDILADADKWIAEKAFGRELAGMEHAGILAYTQAKWKEQAEAPWMKPGPMGGPNVMKALSEIDTALGKYWTAGVATPEHIMPERAAAAAELQAKFSQPIPFAEGTAPKEIVPFKPFEATLPPLVAGLAEPIIKHPIEMGAITAVTFGASSILTAGGLTVTSLAPTWGPIALQAGTVGLMTMFGQHVIREVTNIEPSIKWNVPKELGGEGGQLFTPKLELQYVAGKTALPSWEEAVFNVGRVTMGEIVPGLVGWETGVPTGASAVTTKRAGTWRSWGARDITEMLPEISFEEIERFPTRPNIGFRNMLRSIEQATQYPYPTGMGGDVPTRITAKALLPEERILIQRFTPEDVWAALERPDVFASIRARGQALAGPVEVPGAHGTAHFQRTWQGILEQEEMFPELAAYSDPVKKAVAMFHDVTYTSEARATGIPHEILGAYAVRHPTLFEGIPEIEALLPYQREQVAQAIVKHTTLKAPTAARFSYFEEVLSESSSPLAKALANADRLDLPRVGARVRERELFTDISFPDLTTAVPFRELELAGYPRGMPGGFNLPEGLMFWSAQTKSYTPGGLPTRAGGELVTVPVPGAYEAFYGEPKVLYGGPSMYQTFLKVGAYEYRLPSFTFDITLFRQPTAIRGYGLGEGIPVPRGLSGDEVQTWMQRLVQTGQARSESWIAGTPKAEYEIGLFPGLHGRTMPMKYYFETGGIQIPFTERTILTTKVPIQQTEILHGPLDLTAEQIRTIGPVQRYLSGLGMTPEVAAAVIPKISVTDTTEVVSAPLLLSSIALGNAAISALSGKAPTPTAEKGFAAQVIDIPDYTQIAVASPLVGGVPGGVSLPSPVVDLPGFTEVASAITAASRIGTMAAPSFWTGEAAEIPVRYPTLELSAALAGVPRGRFPEAGTREMATPAFWENLAADITERSMPKWVATRVSYLEGTTPTPVEPYRVTEDVISRLSGGYDYTAKTPRYPEYTGPETPRYPGYTPIESPVEYPFYTPPVVPEFTPPEYPKYTPPEYPEYTPPEYPEYTTPEEPTPPEYPTYYYTPYTPPAISYPAAPFMPGMGGGAGIARGRGYVGVIIRHPTATMESMARVMERALPSVETPQVKFPEFRHPTIKFPEVKFPF